MGKIVERHLLSVPDPRGGQKGHMPPEATTRHTLPPGKKLIIDIMTPKASCKKMVSVRVAHSNPIPTRLQGKNGRALVKHGNLLPLIRYQTTPHCDARDSKCQIEP